MFDQTFVDTNVYTRKPWTIGVSLILQLGVTAVLLIIPLLHPEMLQLKLEIPVWVPLKPPHTRELPPQPTATTRSKTSPIPRIAPVFTAPTRVPRQISMEPDAPQIASLMMTGPASASGSAVIPGLSDAMPVYTTPPPIPPVIKKPELPKGPTHVSSGVQSARLIFGPTPPYPPLAKAAHAQGTVRIQAIIAPDGAIRNLNVMSGPPLLIKAALDAVRQWRYQPTLLSGEPVEVATEIDVNFTLSQ